MTENKTAFENPFESGLIRPLTEDDLTAIASIFNKPLPAYMGIKSIGYEWLNNMEGAILHYEDNTYSETEATDILWDWFLEDGNSETDETGFNEFVKSNIEDVLCLMSECE